MSRPLTTEEVAAVAEEAGLAPEGFTPDTADKADWVLKQIAARRAEAALIRENAERMARRIDAEAAFFEWRFGAALQDFARRQLEASGNGRKSVRLFHGCLGWRTAPARIAVAEGPNAEARALAWAKEHLPEAVCHVEALDRAVLKGQVAERDGAAVATGTGEVVSWAAVLPAEERFYIR